MKRSPSPAGVHRELPPGVRAWLSFEQGVNERIRNEGQHPPIAADLAQIPSPYHPEARAFFQQEARLLPASKVRRYGDPLAELGRVARAFPRGVFPVFEHPWPAPRGKRAKERGGTGVLSTPTSSFRSVLAWSEGQPPFVLKLSLNTVIGKIRRVLREDQVARGLVVARVLDSVPASHRKKLGLEWFDERAGIVATDTRTGWLLRALPPCLSGSRGSKGAILVPAFSLISRRGDDPPLLVEMIRGSGLPAALFVMRSVLRPYVSALAYLLFEHGIETEPHSQNVLFEMTAEGRLSGTLVLRDWSDTSVNWALRIARARSLEVPQRTLRPRGAPFSLVSIAAGHSVNSGRSRMIRAGDTVERYGLRSFVWTFAESLVRYFPGFPRVAVERAFLKLWQGAAAQYLGCSPEVGDGPRRIAVDEAVFHSLEQTSWEVLSGHGTRALLPTGAEALRLGPPIRRKPGRVYARVETPIGDLFLDGPRPAFLRPAF